MIGGRVDKRQSWLLQQERKRSIRAWAIAISAYALGFTVLWLLGLFAVQDVGAYSGPVMVRLGKPEGLDLPTPKPEVIPAPPQEPVSLPQPLEQPQAESAPPTPPVPKPSPKPAQPAKPVPQPLAQPSPQPVPQAPPSYTVKGSETGNSYDMTFEASSGTVSRGMYEPIYLYMPLPMELPDALYQLIPDRGGLPGTAEQRKTEFRGVYELSSTGSWKLKGRRQPALDQRPAIWAMLEDAGYDMRRADYKDGKTLRPIEILFKVSVYKGGSVRLEDVYVERSSGYSELDEAVLYAFKKAGFTNSGDRSITGRFVYRFD